MNSTSTAAVIIQAVLPVLSVGASGAWARGTQAPSATKVKRDAGRDLPGRRLTIFEAPAMNGKVSGRKRGDEAPGLAGLFEWCKKQIRRMSSLQTAKTQ